MEDGNGGKKSWQRHTHFYCPVCGHTFSHEEMWRRLADDCHSKRDVARTLECSVPIVVKHAKRYNLQFGEEPEGTEDWGELAEELGYESPRDMFYSMKVRDSMSYRRIAGALGQPVDRVKLACKVFLAGEEGGSSSGHG